MKKGRADCRVLALPASLSWVLRLVNEEAILELGVVADASNPSFQEGDQEFKASLVARPRPAWTVCLKKQRSQGRRNG